jgi:hypothetical protein
VEPAALEDLAGVAQEERQELELAAREREVAPTAPRGVGGRVELEVAGHEPVALGRRAAAQQRV